MGLIIKSGVDIVQVEKFIDFAKNPEFLEKVFTDNELCNRDFIHLAGLFALKEAFFKAASPKIKNWKEIEITYEKKRPKINFLEDSIKNKITSIDCSISHDGDYAIAFVVILFE